LILTETGDHLELLWPDLVGDPRKHLLLTTAKTALGVLTKPSAPGQPWTPSFGRDDLTALCGTVFDELIRNPQWLLTSAEKADKSVALALEAALDVLRSRGDRRLGTDTAVEVLRAAVHAVALRGEFLDALPAGASMAGRPVLAAALDAIIGTIFGDAVTAQGAWRVVRAEVVTGIVRIGLDELGRFGPSEKTVAALRAWLNEQAALLAAGKPWDLASFESGLRAALAPA
jgi:hypothetical protein